ncbi:MAG: glucosylglycerol 3-phosphatase [Elainellaceae cyanobacterium]
MTSSTSSLHTEQFSLRHDELLRVLSETENLLIVQDLDGVCMGLVKDPLTREIEPGYVEAAQQFAPHFYVLTNGEHIGQRGVNGILGKAFGDVAVVGDRGLFLPGLAAGGVQWQDRFGSVSHPGVSDQELEFLKQVPAKIQAHIRQFFEIHPQVLPQSEIERCVNAASLDNIASPTANLNVFYEILAEQPDIYGKLQRHVELLMEQLLQEAAALGMADSFFVHYAPNLGRDEAGLEILRPATATDSGTTDFQFMLRGAVKEAGVVAILNHYIFQRTGTYPLGEDFSARTAPRTHEELLALVQEHFDPKDLPLIVGVGDTVNSSVEIQEGKTTVRRGGSDRHFLWLVQDIGRHFDTGNIVVYVDSSGGEVLNRKALKVVDAEDNAVEPESTPLDAKTAEPLRVIEGPCDPQDTDEPLQLNVVFPGGHPQYCAVFQQAARQRTQLT